MITQRFKSFTVAAFSVFCMLFSAPVFAQGHEGSEQHTETTTHETKEEKLDPAKIIMEHIKDAHEFHFFTIGDFHASVPLPVILYSPSKGFSVFSSGKFHHGHAEYNGYKLEEGEIKATDGSVVYDFSLTKNVV